MTTLLALSIESVGGWAIGIVGGTGILWGLLMVMMRGFWEKTGKPAIKETLAAIQADPEAVKARHEELTRAMEQWHNHPDQVKTRREFVEDVLDDAVVRTDGIIHLDTTQKLAVVSTTMTQQVATLSVEIQSLRHAVTAQVDENRQTAQANSEKVSKIEGGIDVLLAHFAPKKS